MKVWWIAEFNRIFYDSVPESFIGLHQDDQDRVYLDAFDYFCQVSHERDVAVTELVEELLEDA